jgi:hypothetical protein
LPTNGLPTDRPELYLIIHTAIGNEDATINRIAYQANVLIKDETPDLDSLLVRALPIDSFAPRTLVFPGHDWEFQITLTGPVIDPGGLTVQVQSDINEVPIATAFVPGGGHLPETQAGFILQAGQTSAIFRAPATGSVFAKATITATGTHAVRTAEVDVSAPR